MRDAIVLLIIFAAVPVCLFNPYFGAVMWTWIAYFNPHRYTWGFAYNFPVAMVIAIPTLTGLMFARKLNKNIFTRETVLLLSLWAWYCITTFNVTQTSEFAGHADDAVTDLKIICKILLMAFVIILVTTSKSRFKYLIMVTGFSFGLVALKGALFGARTDGAFRVYGPPDTFIADNNDLGLALNMSIPMLLYLAQVEENRKLRLLMKFIFFSGVFCVLLTYSRGALLGLVVIMTAISLKSKHKVVAMIMLAIIAMGVLAYAPDAWMDRMGNFANGNLDGSAWQRIITWRFAMNFIQHYPLMGGGFEVFPDVSIFQKYVPEQLPGGFRSSGPHSIYFQILGEQGFIGFFLFVSLLFSSLFSLFSIGRKCLRDERTTWVKPYASMLMVGLMGYAVSGAFLGRAYFDLYYQMIAYTIVLKLLYRQSLKEMPAAEVVASDQAQPFTEEPVEVPELQENFE